MTVRAGSSLNSSRYQTLEVPCLLHGLGDDHVQGVLVAEARSTMVVIPLVVFVKINTEGQVDGLLPGSVALDDTVVVFPRALFEEC
jgi:hypothetical protein